MAALSEKSELQHPDPGTRLATSVSRRNGTKLLRLEGEVDLATGPVCEEFFDTHAVGPGPVVFDLTAVTFMDSTGVHALIRTFQRLRKCDAAPELLPSSSVRHIISATATDHFFAP